MHTHCLKTDREISMYTFQLLSSTRSLKRIYQGETLRLLRTNSSAKTFKENINNFKSLLSKRAYPKQLTEGILSEVKFVNSVGCKAKAKGTNETAALCHAIPPITAYLKKILMSQWHLIENKTLLREIYKEPLLFSYRRGKFLKDILVRAKL